MEPAIPSFTKTDCDLLARYGSARVQWSRVDATGKRKLLELRTRIKRAITQVAERYRGPVETKVFLGPAHMNGRVSRDYYGCLYPAAVPTKSFALQFAFILSGNGAELCFCMGAERRDARNPEIAAINRRMLEEAQQQLAHLPPDVIEAVTQRLTPEWRFRTAWRRSPRANDFESFAEWVQYAASPLGEGASVSCNLTPKALERLGGGIVDKLVDMVNVFAPVFDYVYGSEPTSETIGQDRHSNTFGAEVPRASSYPPYASVSRAETPYLAEHSAPPYESRFWGAVTAPSRSQASQPIEPFTLDDAVADLFLSREEFERTLSLLRHKQNLILEGAPGVGKTFIAQRLAYALLGERDPNRIELVQFHQSYSYEDFVQGWRPAAGGGFVLRNGVFYEFARSASRDPNRPYVFLIDEINRGNVSKIFGELLMLIERDKRGDAFAIPLTYSTGRSDRFAIPQNIYFIGTMNTADRSLAMVDYALRRRFAFTRLQPAFGSKAFTKLLARLGVSRELARRIAQRMTALNEEIVEDRKRLGPGFEIGHSFFVPSAKGEYDESWYRNIIIAEIEPLLREYWFDDPDRVVEAVAQLLA
jgi:MoxR-like ATPase